MDNITIVLILTILAIIASTTILWIWERKKAQQFLAAYAIPGPPTSFITGNFELFLKDTIHGFSKLLSEYGEVCSFYIGIQPNILVANLEMIRKICVTEANKFRNRPDYVISRIVPLSDGLLSLRDDRWKVSRQTLSPTFSASKMKWMVSLMEEPVSTFLSKMSDFADNKTMFDMYDHAEALTLEVIGRCAFGTNVNCQKDMNDPFFQAVSSFMKYTRNIVVKIGLVFPGLENLALFVNKNFMPAGYQARASMVRLKKVIGQRKKMKDASKIRDLLQLMIDASPEGDGNKAKLTDEEVVGNAFSFVVAGFETTATAIAFTFYALAKHPEYQEELYSEIMEKIDGNAGYDDVMFGMPFLDQIFNESLRLYPPVVVFTNRECGETCEIEGQVFPKGSSIMVPVYDIHHNEKYWPDPYVFDPSRFAPENKGNIVPNSFMPFGIGQRNCIGMRFAMLEAKLTIVDAIRKFKFEFCAKTEDPLTLSVPVATLNPDNGIYLTVTRRE